MTALTRPSSRTPQLAALLGAPLTADVIAQKDTAVDEQAIFILFFILMLGMLGWFFLVSRLYKLLEERHPDVYDNMGRPTLFLNNPPRASFELMRFLFGRSDTENVDSIIRNHRVAMRIYFGLYLFGFIGFTAILTMGHAP